MKLLQLPVDDTSLKLSVEERFKKLVEQWREERPPSSFIEHHVMCPAYQQIIGMGREVIPLLLHELEQKPDWWIWALMAITGADPVDPQHERNLREMAKDWLEWGHKYGYYHS